MGSEAELADMLQKSLKGKRYLIVVDDMWKTEAWDAVRLCFPSENKGSGILLTTRNTEAARDAGTKNLSLQMDLMGPDESWSLFKSVAFSSEELRSDLKTIGKQIAEKCHGLPLTIVVVAGLFKSKRTREDWESVAKDVTSFVTNDPDELCSHVLGLSYNHLTSGLKTCLLHFGFFPEDSEIPTKKLMRSWMAEGFLKLENDLEGEAEKCLQELVDRCLVLVFKKSVDGTKIRSCKVHDLIYELCVREIQRENIFIMNDIVLGQSDSGWPYLSMQKMQTFKRVTDEEIDNYCRYGLCRALLTSVHRQLRDHDNNDLLKRTRSIFSFHLEDSYHILRIRAYSFQITQCLGVETHSTYHSLQWGFVHTSKNLQVMESADIHCSSRLLPRSAKAFPAMLKKLKLERTFLSWSYLDIIAELPNLEVLKLIDDACDDEEWHPNVKGFTRLKLLLIEVVRSHHNDDDDEEEEEDSDVDVAEDDDDDDSDVDVAEDDDSDADAAKHDDNYDLNCSSIDGERNLIWSNIQSVSCLLPYCCTEKVLSGIQNIKKLCIRGHVYDYDMREEVMDIREIVDLHQLETLSIKVDRYHVSHWSSRPHKSTVCVPKATYFPTELKKLKLVGTRLAWEDLNITGQWPNLEVLKLKTNACRGLEWRPIEGGFCRLKF
ncbi:hypothetical protein CQW23_07029 [Capsicum baccatum]|uniref:Uncharacterized protein n=1 Tax=Capsicum baccatum TaxID=33114 RepID=A0A2G2X523_CAPBA|nr:hypothetical protein CQW23_07029 [Capsicum baccatum]